MKKKNNFFITFQQSMGICTKREKVWFWITFSLFTIYVEWIVFAQSFHVTNNISFSNVVVALALIPLCFYLVYKVKNIKSMEIYIQYSSKKTIAVFAAVSLATFAIFFIWQLANWPGYFSPDAVGQIGQAANNSYNDWHPVMHTLLTYWLPYRLFGTWAIITFQLVYFSLAVGYLYSVLFRYGCSKAFMVFSWLYIVLNYNTASIMLYPWKDSALTILALVIFTQVIQIYITEGQWLKKRYNLTAFCLVMFFANGVRHNAILLIAPIFVLLAIFIKNSRKTVAVACVAVVVATMLFKGPVFYLLDVTQPDKRQTEILGLPMTVLSHLYVADPECLSDEAFEFMDNLTLPVTWETKYVIGNFNTVKWSEGITDKIEAEGAGKILNYTISGSLKRPDLALQAFIALTRMVWTVDDSYGWKIYGECVSSPYIQYGPSVDYLTQETQEYTKLVSNGFGKHLFNFTGPVILLLILTAVAKLGNGNMAKSFMVLPILAYNFGTMLLLTGDDFRFFHLNFVIAVPLLYLFLSKKSADADNISE